ncbi:MAG: GDSL-like Lipase/Acylhydrolase [bacterium ADurb.Bin478]|nr:SGNH/GDSL hydrolase family protein [bacterium]OPZ69020.1 MAG: GDSL-like Lipase/Acylhydrolase [bacterium ADurb.Bin478]
MKQMFGRGQTVLFLGDSITDCGRNREEVASLGTGYPAKVAHIHHALYADNQVRFINKGLSGARISDLISMNTTDILEIAPDFISILVGINDVWRRYDANTPRPVREFAAHYASLLELIKSSLPQTTILIMEPFLLPTMPDKACWREDLDPKIQIVREMAARYADYYIPLDGMMAANCVAKYRPEELSADGVHPTDTGHALIASAFLKTLDIV